MEDNLSGEIDMGKNQVLFVCIHNSARSQMAETFLNAFGGDQYHAESAGLEPGALNPIVVEAMKEAGFDISENKTKSVYDSSIEGKSYDYVITVCAETSAERCPVFPGKGKRFHWGFEDPSALQGDHAVQLQGTRLIRDRILTKVKEWISEQS